MTPFTTDSLEAVREMTDLPVEVALDDPDYCKLLIADSVTLEVTTQLTTLSLDGWSGVYWQFGTVYDAAAAADHIENALCALGAMAKASICDKAHRDAQPSLMDAFDAFVASTLEVR